MSFQRIGDGLPGVVARWIDDPELRWGLVQRTWQTVAGEAVARHARPWALEAGILRVAVDEPAWQRTLQDMETELLARLADALGEDVVRELVWCDDPGAAPQTASS